MVVLAISALLYFQRFSEKIKYLEFILFYIFLGLTSNNVFFNVCVCLCVCVRACVRARARVCVCVCVQIIHYEVHFISVNMITRLCLHYVVRYAGPHKCKSLKC